MRKLLQLAILFLVCAAPALVPSAHAQTGADNETQMDCSATTACTFNVTVTSSVDTMLCYRVSIVDSGQAAYVSTVTKPTRNSQVATKIISSPAANAFYNPGAGNTANRVEIYCQLAPTVGTFAATVTLAAIPSNEAVIDAYSVYRVAQSLTPDSLGAPGQGIPSGGSGPPQPSCSVTTTGRFDMVIDVSLQNAGTTNPQAVSPSLRQYAVGTSFTGFGSTQVVPTATTVTMNWNGVNNAWTQACVAFSWDGTVAPGRQFYLDTAAHGASDSNNGLSTGSPWLSPYHVVNGGDVLNMAAGNGYDYNNYRIGHYGPVSSPSGDFAWVKGAPNFGSELIISAAGYNGVTPNASYWGVQGLVVTYATPSTGQACFQAAGAGGNPGGAPYVIFANDIAFNCGGDGLNLFQTDYVAFLGIIAYNTAQNPANCYSGVHPVSPTAADNLPGTHVYLAGSFLFNNVDPVACGTPRATDGQGASFDTIGVSSQWVMDNNISAFNGANGFQIFQSTSGAHFYIRHNTSYGNETGTVNANPCAEITGNNALSVEVFLNLVQTTAATACQVSGSPVTYYGVAFASGNSSDIAYCNFVYSASGNNFSAGGGTIVNSGPCANVTGTNPNFANPVDPSTPNCAEFATTTACMATVIANFTPTNAAAQAYGYQIPSAGSVFDPLFPQWLCSVTNLPAGLVQMGCGAGSFIGPGSSIP